MKMVLIAHIMQLEYDLVTSDIEQCFQDTSVYVVVDTITTRVSLSYLRENFVSLGLFHFYCDSIRVFFRASKWLVTF